MKSKSIMICLTLLTVLIAVLGTGCSKINSYQKSIYYDAAKISANGDSYSFVSRNGDFINNNYAISFSGFSGKQTIWKLIAQEDTDLLIDCNIEINRGQFKICLISDAKEVTTLAEGSTTKRKTIHLTEGTNYLALVGIDANGEIDLLLADINQVSVNLIEN